MIEVKNLNKYFNKNKPNEIHAINNANLVFPKTGLVCMLGPSGSGKTTLLNVIGGLDKVDNGQIIIENNVINKYHFNKWDDIRNHHFGYIFQNYVLLQDLNVYQNLEFVLKMLKLDKQEINERINYALNAVGMIKYKKRRPSQLSGGQQQRIAIARALVKSPDVVIADEPTGNMDERNTMQIMNIIKKISKECLVIMVTHERRLAQFYGDLIIEISDGKIINNSAVSQNDELYNLYDNNLYLKEYQKHIVNDEDLTIKYFYQDKKPKLDLNIIFQDNTFYIHSKKGSFNIKFIDQDSEIQVYDTKKPVSKQDSINEFDYYLPKITKSKSLNKSVLQFKDTFKMAIAHLSRLRKRQKMLFLVMILSSLLVVIGFTNFFDSSVFNEKNYLDDNRNLVQVIGVENYTPEDFKNLIQTLEVDYLLGPAANLSLEFLHFSAYAQNIGNTSLPKLNSLLPYELLKNPKIVLGRLPENIGEVVVDKWLIDQMLVDSDFIANGAQALEQFMGLEFYNYHTGISGKIVGIVDTNNPNIYINLREYQFSTINALNSDSEAIHFPVELYRFTDETHTTITEYYDVNEYKNKEISPKPIYEFSDLTLGKYEVLVSHQFYRLIESHPNIIESNQLTFGDNKVFTIVGVFHNRTLPFNHSYNHIIVSEQSVEELYYDYISISGTASVYSDNKNATISKIESLNLVGDDFYKSTYEKHHTFEFNLQIYLLSIVILLASLIFLYFLMRSSLITRVYEIGVYRALGVKKSIVYKMFVSEIIIITLITSIIGITIASIFITQVNTVYPFIFYPWYISLLSFGFIIICNIIVGLLPIKNLLRFTPSQILSKYDI